MITKKPLKIRLVQAIFGCFFGILGLILPFFANTTVYAIEGENGEEVTEMEAPKEEPKKEQTPVETRTCDDSLGSLGWLVCPTTGKVSEAVDWLYDKNKELLEINPVEASEESPIYQIWKYCLGIANIAFIIFLLIVVYSQLTGVGISNYGIKKALPKLIIAAIMVNLSFLICSVAVDVSNIIGAGLRGIFTTVQEATIPAVLSVEHYADASTGVAMSDLYSSLAGGTALASGIGVIAFEGGEIWMLIPAVLGALVAVVVGLITIALRQVVVILLIMVAPLAIVAYIMPNTENLFKKWKDLLVKMLVFYPMYSLLFGASSLAGWAIISSATDGFGMILGVAVQIFPLFFSWSLMKMSGTFLGTINAKITGMFAAPLATNRAWAESLKLNTRANTLANGITPSARLMQYLDKRRALREEDTKNAMAIASGKTTEYVQRKIADSEIGEVTGRSKRTPRYTRNAKAAHNYSLIAKNAVAHTEHVLNNYGEYFKHDSHDTMLNEQSQHAWIDYGRAMYQKDIDDENDIQFLIEKYLKATKRKEDGTPVDEVAYNRYMTSVAGANGEQRLQAKIIAQAAKVESKQRSEYSIFHAKYGHNGFNKREFRNWLTGYNVDDDGWAVDENGKRLIVRDKNDKPVLDKNGKEIPIEIVQGDALTKAPERLVLYNKRDENGLYFDYKDQDGNLIARIHRGLGADGQNHDDAAFIKETLSNYDIPIADPINNIYSILSGIRAPIMTKDKDGNDVIDSVIETPQGQNDIGLARYSTTIGRAMKDYKGNAAWAGAMFNSGIGNRQIRNSSQHAIWVLDSIVKTLKPGAYNTQNPASVDYITAILNPQNWDKIFTEEELKTAQNINNKFYGGEKWFYDENGNVLRDEKGEIMHETVKEPNYEQRMNLIKRKLLFPAMKKVLPSFDRLRTSNTADNQKPGTADAQYEFLRMVENEWIKNDKIPFDPLLVNQDLQSASRDFKQRKHDKDGNLIYATEDRKYKNGDYSRKNLLNELEDLYDRNADISYTEELISKIFALLSSDERYSRSLERFDELCRENPGATIEEIHRWFVELDELS